VEVPRERHVAVGKLIGASTMMSAPPSARTPVRKDIARLRDPQYAIGTAPALRKDEPSCADLKARRSFGMAEAIHSRHARSFLRKRNPVEPSRFV
jgi:hypothetical protein